MSNASGMDDFLIPEWIKQERETKLRRDAARAATGASLKAAMLTIKAAAPKFWRRLLEELDMNLRALPEIDIKGIISITGYACRVQVALIGPISRQTYCDLFYTPGDIGIRCSFQNGIAMHLIFSVPTDTDVIGVVTENQFTPMNEKQAAEFIIKQMTDQIGNPI